MNKLVQNIVQMKSKNYVICFLLIVSLRNMMMQYSYPAQKSITHYAVTVFKDKKVNGYTDIIEIHTDYNQCVAACYRKNFCKSIDAEILNISLLRCRFFNITSPNVQFADGFLFISRKPPNCTLSCSLTLNPCGECKCHPSCAGRNRRPYICNCTKAAGIEKTCQDHFNNGFNKTGIYQISPNGSVFETVCEMEKVERQNPKVTNPICYSLKQKSELLFNNSVSYCVVTCANHHGIDIMFFSVDNGCFCGHKLSLSQSYTQWDYCAIDSSSKNCNLSKGDSNQLIGYNDPFNIGYISWRSCVSFCVDYQKKNPTQNGHVASFIVDIYGDCQCLYGFSGQKISYKIGCSFYETIPPTALPQVKVNERQLTWDNLLATLTSLEKTYSVSFKLYLQLYSTLFENVIHLTIGGNNEQYGDRCPAVWINLGKLIICSAVNFEKNYCITTYQLPLYEWSTIKISQVQQNGVYEYNIRINEAVVYSTVNTNPQSFSNVYVYSADSWHSEFKDGFIKDLRILNENGIETSDPVEQKLIYGNLNATLSLIEKTYSVSFKLKPRSYSQGWKSVIHLTIGDNWGQYGCRCPAVWFHGDGSGRLYISAAVNGNHNYIFTTQPLPLKQWSSLQISQFQMNGIYMYTVYLNESLVHSVVNKNPQSFSNVKVYTADPWHDVQDGSIKDLKITSGKSGIWIPMMARFFNWDSGFWNRSYDAYENGFGLINQQWIGLKKLYQITSTFFTDMRVDYFFEDSITFSTMYYNVNIGSSEDSYVLSYGNYDPRDSLEPDRLNANGTTFKNCSKWWTTSCNEYVSPTLSYYISYGSTENLLSIQFFLRTNETK
ncbi:uncharacterized protein LOC105845905 isoform X1 [Hydra vulgaris]|uniref:uncharacterized protein LOC105845905 isoform X1 n=2 Tax=Hydra vulgaris TaxID=6087 RepID=UPI001F5FDEBB|nr:uncharacterized protein LOC105845905 isoform X1 [Hydra vulgaris]